MFFSVNDSFKIIQDDPISLEERKGSIFSKNSQKLGKVSETEKISTALGQRVLQSAPDRVKKSSFINNKVSSLFTMNEIFNFFDNEKIEIKDNKTPTKNETDQTIRNWYLEWKIEEFQRNIHKLESSYYNWMKDYKTFIHAQKEWFWCPEYIITNKDNILEMSKGLVPHDYFKFKNSFDIGDQAYKWLNGLLSFITHGAHYLKISYVQQQLEKNKQLYTKLKSQTFKNPGSLSEKMRKIYTSLERLDHKLKIDKAVAFNKMTFKFMNIATNLLALLCESSVLGWMAKTANKVAKCTFNIFKNMWGIWETFHAYFTQKEWLYYLKPRFVVNIHSDHLTIAEQKFRIKQEETQEKITDKLKNFLLSLDQCKTLEDVKKAFKKAGGVSVELPLTIEHFQLRLCNPRFRRQLIQSYYRCAGQQVMISQKHAELLLLKRKEEHDDQINKSLVMMNHHIDQCQNMTIDEIKIYFAQLHIDIQSLKIPHGEEIPFPPTTEEEWKKCSQNQVFCLTLAQQWMEYQETTAQVSMQTMLQFLLSKHEVERQFLFFRGAQYVINLFSTTIQLMLFHPQAHLLTLTSILELIFADFRKLGIPGTGLINLFYPLYPDLSFKIESLLMLLVEHFFAVKHKPNQYSLESYKKAFQKNALELILKGYAFCLFFEQAVLWLNMRLIENCLLRRQYISLKDDDRFIQINQRYEQKRMGYKHKINELKENLKQFAIEDTKLSFNPQMKQADSTFKDVDPIQQLVEVLEKGDFNYFPQEILDFFEDHIGLKLTNEKKHLLKKELEQFFSKGEDTFIQTFHSNRFAYLRALKR